MMTHHHHDAIKEKGGGHEHAHEPAAGVKHGMGLSHIAVCGGVAIIILAGYFVDVSVSWRRPISRNSTAQLQEAKNIPPVVSFEEAIIPSAGVVIPVRWGDLGRRMIEAGVIDAGRFEQVYVQRGGISGEMRAVMYENPGEYMVMNKDNAGFFLNMLWALGLSNKNSILEKGPMRDPRYGNTGNFASTGGWPLSRGSAMDHYSMHGFMTLSPEQQSLVERVAKGIYRPCCGNSVHFPDCNHGMAMLGLLELMASQGVSEQEMWKTALAVNSYWFPETYFTIATYMKNNGVEWENVNPQEILGINFSSAQGYARVSSQVVKPQQQGGPSGCGFDAGVTAPQRQQGGCGI